MNMIEKNGRLKQERSKIFEKMLNYSDCIRGTVIEIYKMCNNKNCECHSTNRKKHGLAYYLSSSHKGKTRMIYLPFFMVEAVKKQTDDYKKMLNLMERISEINSEIFKLKKKIKKGVKNDG